MKHPVIGITTNFTDAGATLAEGYYKSIEAAGAVPVLLPPSTDPESWREALNRVDGILLTGGSDINPLRFGEEPQRALGSINPVRDEHELRLTREALERGLPILAICRGIQILAVAAGGSLIQDIPSELPQCLKHSQQAPRWEATHSVDIVEGSRLAALFGTATTVNSFHHQAVREPGRGLYVTARAKDGVIEAIEGGEGVDVIGVQWHPECFILNKDARMLPLFQWLAARAAVYAEGRRVLQQILTVDTHCDAPMKFAEGAQITRRDDLLLTDVEKMEEGSLDASCIVAYIRQEARDEEGLRRATAKADAILDEIERQAAQCPALALVSTPDEVRQARSEGRRAVIRGIENGYALGRDLKNIQRYKNRGVSYITLCHNGDNDLCDSANKSKQEHGGLSALGRKAVGEMNRCGIIIDLSHAAESTFYEVLRVSKQPVMCTHSSARALCDSPRNLTDDQLRALAAAGGVAGVTLYPGFLRAEKKEDANVMDAVRHLLHMISVAGIDHVCFGSDFDGDGGVWGLPCASALPHFAGLLLEAGLSPADLEKIFATNFLRLWQQVLQGQVIS